MPIFRRTILALAASLTMSGTALAAASHIEVMSTNGCGCCIAWTKHLEENGYTAEIENLPMAELMQRKLAAGLKPGLTSCHTGMIAGYVIEGHVPAREIDRLLAERPDAIGLTVPDMPYGSPGMGEPWPDADPYDVLLVRSDRSTVVFASYP
jgi:hypothetical protein